MTYELALLPRPQFLDSYGFPLENSTRVYEYHEVTGADDTHRRKKEEEGEWTNLMNRIIDEMSAEYKKEMDFSDFYSIWEALQNAGLHANQNGGTCRIYQHLRSRGVATGFQDPGTFFRRPAIKQQFESRRVLKYDQFSRNFASPHVGVNDFIYRFTKDIEVDTTSGILWLGHYLPK
jgi:hypothetical protein